MKEIKGLSLIIPTIDSESYIKKTIERTIYIMDVMIDVCPVKNYEIIIALQKKDEKTAVNIYRKLIQQIHKLDKHHRKKMTILTVEGKVGKGKGIHTAIEKAKYEWVAFMDDDLDYKPTWLIGTINRYHQEMKDLKTHLIIPTRYIYERSLKRTILSKTYNAMVKILFPSLIRIKDFQAGIKIIHKLSYDVCFNGMLWGYEKGYFWDTVLIHKFKKFGCKISERSIAYKGKSEQGRSVKNMTKQMIIDMLKYRIYSLLVLH